MGHWLMRVIRPITHPVVATGADLRRYVVRITLTAMLLALLLDVVNQLALFTTWKAAIQSWTLTLLDSGVVAAFIAVLIGRAQRDLQEAKRRVETLSRTDVLTGLPNRRAILEQVAAEDSAMMMLVIADIDRFKSINDRYGHRSGDVVIEAVARRMARHLEEADLVGRLGGEEFAVLCAEPRADRILDALAEFRAQLATDPVVVEGVSITVTISAGVAIREPGEPFDRLYAEADAALYLAKDAGRNGIVLSPRLQRRRGVHHRPKAA